MPTTFLLTNTQQTYINSLMDIPFALFNRQIQIITEGTTVVVSTNPNYNWNYKNKNTNVTTPEVQTIFNAIVDYSPTVTDQLLQQNPDIKAKESRGLVRLSVQPEAVPLLKQAKDIQFDGHSYEIETSDIPRGMFNEFNYFDFWLIRKN